MKLVDMKMTAAEKKDDCCSPCCSEGDYPYGLSINLDKDSMEKLGMSMPACDDQMTMEATVVVTRCSSTSSSLCGDDCNCTLQITKMALSSGTKTAAAALYGKMPKEEC